MKEREHSHRVQEIPDYKNTFCSHVGEIKAIPLQAPRVPGY
jgi:hypothetical protein